jgi:hypothetical protein
MSELKPCPFCGGEAEFERKGTSKVSCIVKCTDCGCTVETGETWASGQSWNTRTQSQCELFTKMLHEVANQYDGNAATDWANGANHVFMLFGKWVATNVPPKVSE